MRLLDSRDLIYLGLLIAIAVWLRCIGLDWSLPDSSRLFTFHPDEGTLVRSAYEVRFLEGQWHPSVYFWGSHFIYVCRLAFVVASWFGVLDLSNPVGWMGPSARPAFLIVRCLSVGSSLLLIGLVYVLGRRLRLGRTATLLASYWVAVCPMFTYFAHFAAVDMCLTQWTTLSVACLVFLATSPSTDRDETLLSASAAFAGVAMATKYSALLLGVPIAATIALSIARQPRRNRTKALIRRISLCSFLFVAAFVICMPYAVLDFAAFRAEFIREIFVRQQEEGYIHSLGTGNGLLYLLAYNFPLGLSWPVWLTAVSGIFLLQRETEKPFLSPLGTSRWMPLVIWIALGVVVFGESHKRFLRYLLPFAPFLCLLAASFFDRAVHWARAISNPLATRAVQLLLCILLAWPLAESVAKVRAFLPPDTHLAAKYWILANAQDARSIGLLDYSFWRSPALADHHLVSRGKDAEGVDTFEVKEEPLPYKIVRLSMSAESLREFAPDYIILNWDMELKNRLRGKDPAALAFWKALGEDYERVAIMENNLPLGFLRIRPAFAAHDWEYVDPTFLIFKQIAKIRGS